MEPGPTVRGGEAVHEQPRRAGMILVRTRPEDALFVGDTVVSDARVVGQAACAGYPQLVEHVARLVGETDWAAETLGQFPQDL